MRDSKPVLMRFPEVTFITDKTGSWDGWSVL